MTKLDESTIIKIFQKEFGNKKFVSEDVETFDLGKIKIIVKTDTLVESTDIPKKMGLEDAARKSVVACVSDFAAKGIRPEFGIISVNLPKNISYSKIISIAKGFKKAATEYGITILGGDTNAGKEIVFNVSIFGNSKKIVTRKDSKIGDIIFVTGPFGYTKIGLDLLLGKRKEKGKFVEKSIKSVTNPKPKVSFGLKNKKYFSSSMDSSDGLSTTLNEMSKQSKKKFVINNIPVRNDVEKYVKSHKLDLISMVFHGGEEYEFVFTVPPKYKEIIKKNASRLKTPIIEIGQVESGNGVFVKEEENYIKIRDSGWKHFR
ncbi:MAG: thiamine-phosphate kinase [Candidatus Nitrosopumilus sp. bin_68KS]